MKEIVAYTEHKMSAKLHFVYKAKVYQLFFYARLYFPYFLDHKLRAIDLAEYGQALAQLNSDII